MAVSALIEETLMIAWSYSGVLLAILVLWRMIFNRYQKGLNKVPGPFLNSVSTIPRFLSVYRSQSHLDERNLHRKYGKIVRLAPKIVSVSDPAEIPQLYGISTSFVKSDFFKLGAFTDERGEYIQDPFTTKDKKVHARLKRGAANGYALHNLIHMEPFIDTVTERLFRILDDFAAKKAICNLGDILKNYAMDAIFAITFGKDFNYLERGDHLALYRVLDVMTDYMAIFGQIPWIHKYLLKNPRLAGWVAGNETSQLQMMDLAIRETEESFKNQPEDGPATFIQLLAKNKQQNPKSITDDEIHGNALGNISAGSDTTAIALRAVFYYLLKNREVYNRLCEEVRSNLTLPVQFSAANDLVYLTGCIKESMRLHPSVGMLLGREAPLGGATVCGYYIGEGIEIGINPMTIHHDPEVFPDPYAFKPERWFKTNEDHLKLMNRCFLTFGHGPHTCSGRHISMLEITKLVPSLILRYDMEFAHGGNEYKFKNRWFTTQSGLNVILSKRG